MMLVDADAKLNREQVLFQKFLRENRFRLASNGIVPPPEIFSRYQTILILSLISASYCGLLFFL
jgi:hypothetical protein